MPEGHTEHNEHQTLDDLMADALKTRKKAEGITEVKLLSREGPPVSRRCFVVRSLIGGDVWSELYGLEVDKKTLSRCCPIQ